jgi:aromatic ring-opening dioxygenase catalytic subunit (LigB family)
MTAELHSSSAPVLYLPHGGGPLPLLGDQQHEALTQFLKTIPGRLPEPEAILIVSAHWETEHAHITSAAHPLLIYDYSGFPPESYDIEYAAPGKPELAQEIFNLLKMHGIQAQLDDQRGFDHGMFVPLKLMYPDAHIPCVQLSLLRSLDPGAHIAMGKALSVLRKKNILVIGSGMSYHNMRTFFTHDEESLKASETFDHWLTETCTAENLTSEQREQRLTDWQHAPSARFCHPREEHLLPLHVCYGIASATTPAAQQVFDQLVMGKKVCALLWQ